MSDKLQLGFEITMDKEVPFRPLKLEFWTDLKKHPIKASSPLKYMGDALTGLSMVKLNHFIKSPMITPHLKYAFAADAWKALDPHFTIYQNSENRIKAMQSKLALTPPEICQQFEADFEDRLESAITPWGVDLTELWPLLNSFQDLEKKIGAPLLYNFSLNFSRDFTDKLHTLYSMLYNLRSVVACDYNSHVEEHTYEGIQMDAVTDYLPRVEYVVNDAQLYYQFKKLSAPFTKNPEDHASKGLFWGPMSKAFQKYSHNACRLIENLPESFLHALNPVDLEEALFLVQVDWLLASPAGLLFKIREEIFGLQEGYGRVMWKECNPSPKSLVHKLQICCEVTPQMVYSEKAA